MHLSCFGMSLKIGYGIVDYFHAAKVRTNGRPLCAG